MSPDFYLQLMQHMDSSTVNLVNYILDLVSYVIHENRFRQLRGMAIHNGE